MRYCEHCGSPTEDNAKFCPSCGKKQRGASKLARKSILDYWPQNGILTPYRIKISFIALVVIVVVLVGIFLAKSFDGKSDKAIEVAKVQETEVESSTMFGSIMDRSLTMEIQIDGSEVTGDYFFDDEGPGMRRRLSGHFSNGRMNLYEMTADGHQAGYFHGFYTYGAFEGFFTDIQGNNRFVKLSTQ